MKFCVIGLGRFGYHVAVSLANHGMEVLAIDSNESIVASIKDKVTHAICMRVTDQESLKAIDIESFDTVIVATAESISESILVTALLKKLKVATVIARSTTDIHNEILRLLGADMVIQPEQDMGTKLAYQLSSPFADMIEISQNLAITQLTTPAEFIGKTIAEVMFFENYQVQCIGVKTEDGSIDLDEKHIIAERDKLILAGMRKQLETLARL